MVRQGMGEKTLENYKISIDFMSYINYNIFMGTQKVR